MDIRFVDNQGEAVCHALEEMLEGAKSLRVAVAYARGSGLEAVPALRRLVGGSVELRFLAGLDFQQTDLDTLATLHSPPRAETRVWYPLGERLNFHPKVYMAFGQDEVRALVGSSNFTSGGFRSNVEANLLIRAAPTEPAAAELVRFHDELWNSPFAVPVSATMREDYQRLQRSQIELGTSDAKRLRDAVLHAAGLPATA